jgi:hypothetical protein
MKRVVNVLASIAAVVCGLGVGPQPSLAQFRTLPPDTDRGYIRHVRETLVQIDGTDLRLAPGATIRNQQNLIIVPTALPPDGAVAEYVTNAAGELTRVWLLTPEEQQRPRKPKPRR